MLRSWFLRTILAPHWIDHAAVLDVCDKVKKLRRGKNITRAHTFS